VGAVLWPRVLLGGDFTVGLACGGAVPGECRLELQLLRGGVALRWAGVPAGLSNAIGEASVGRLVAAAAAYELGVLIVEVAAASWGEREGSMSIGADVVALVRLETEVLSVVGGGQGRAGNFRPSWRGSLFFGRSPCLRGGFSPGWCRCGVGAER